MTNLMKMKFNKYVLVGGLIGGLYGLISYFLLTFIFKDLGEGGIILWFFPPYWPVIVISTISAVIVILLGFSLKTDLALYLAGVINIILWVILGAFIGLIFKKMKNKAIWIGGIIGLIFGGGLSYGFSSNLGGLISSIMIFILIGMLIGFIIQKTRKKKI